MGIVGIFIGDKDYWRKGYGTDAMKTLIKFIFYEINIEVKYSPNEQTEENVAIKKEYTLNKGG